MPRANDAPRLACCSDAVIHPVMPRRILRSLRIFFTACSPSDSHSNSPSRACTSCFLGLASGARKALHFRRFKHRSLHEKKVERHCYETLVIPRFLVFFYLFREYGHTERALSLCFARTRLSCDYFLLFFCISADAIR